MAARKASKHPSPRGGKALLLPMPAMDAAQLVLRTRLILERVRAGKDDRALFVHLLEIAGLAGFVTEAGYGRLDVALVRGVGQDLAEVLVRFDETGRWENIDSLIDSITSVVNEYDRMIGAVRLEVFMRAPDHLERSGMRGKPSRADGG